MTEQSSAVPAGIYPYLTVMGGKAAVEFYKKAFGAEQGFVMMADDGERYMHTQLRINGNVIMLSDDFPEFRDGMKSPAPAGVTLHLEVDNADVWWQRAVDAGAEITMPLADQFWGDRFGQLKDPFGHSWSIGAPIAKAS